MRQMICEVEPFFDKEFDGTLNRVMRVLHVCNSIEVAKFAAGFRKSESLTAR